MIAMAENSSGLMQAGLPYIIIFTKIKKLTL